MKESVYSICGMCAVRCPLRVEVEDGKVTWVEGNSHDGGMGTSICAKGAVFIFWIGLFPNSMLSFMHVSVSHLLEQVTGNPEGIANGVQLAVDHNYETASKAVHHLQQAVEHVQRVSH